MSENRCCDSDPVVLESHDKYEAVSQKDRRVK